MLHTGIGFCLLALAAPVWPQETEVVPRDPEGRVERSFQPILEDLDPLHAGWSSEARSDAAGRQLGRIAAFLEDPSSAPETLVDLFADGFEARVPVELSESYQAVPFRVRKAVDARLAEDARGFLEGLRGGLEGTEGVHAKLKLIEVREEDSGVVTQALLSLAAQRDEGSLQWNAWWACRWAGAGETGLQLAGLDVLDHQEVWTAGAPLFSDDSEKLFGTTTAWGSQLEPGLDAWRSRLDTRLGVPLLGHAAGIAVGDVNGDGLEDLYLCQPGGLPNKLFLHEPGDTLRDASADSGVNFLDFSRSALLVDLDGDGDRDLVVNAAERLLLLSNDGRARFWLQAAMDAPDATSLAAADIDLDGDLDLYQCAYASPYDHSALPVPYHDAENGKPNRLLENRGDWIFVDATAARGLDVNNRRFSFAASFEDFDLDGDPDLYVANDFGRNNLYRNDGGTFVDVAPEAGVEDVSAGMGVSWGDYDGDGRFDLYVSNMYSSAGNRIAYQPRFQAGAGDSVRAQYQRHAHGNTLFRNLGDGRFKDVTGDDPLGPAMGRWAWGALFVDLDNDGWQDVLSPNGFLTEELTTDL